MDMAGSARAIRVGLVRLTAISKPRSSSRYLPLSTWRCSGQCSPRCTVRRCGCAQGRDGQGAVAIGVTLDARHQFPRNGGRSATDSKWIIGDPRYTPHRASSRISIAWCQAWPCSPVIIEVSVATWEPRGRSLLLPVSPSRWESPTRAFPGGIAGQACWRWSCGKGSRAGPRLPLRVRAAMVAGLESPACS
jgi:hypothetical protein